MGKWVDKAGLQYVVDWIKDKLSLKVDKVSGKGLSTNDFTNEAKQKLDSIDAGANNYVLPQASNVTLGGIKLGTGLETDNNGFVNVVGGQATAIAWNNVNNKPTTLAGYGIEDAVDATEFNALKNKVTGAYKYMGTVATYIELANIVSPENGNIYNVEDTGMNYAWNAAESKWDELGANIDLSNYVQYDDLLAITPLEIDEITGSAGSLQSFQALLAKGGTVELGTNITATEAFVIDKDVTINLCGKNIETTMNDVLFQVAAGKTLTLTGEGVVSCAKGVGVADDGAEIIIESGTYNSSVDIGFRARHGSKVTVRGGSITAREGGVGAFYESELEINGGTITGTDNFPLFTNGTPGMGGNTIVLNGGKLIGNIVSAGYEACGVYIANENDSFVMNGGEIIANGGVGLLVRSGNTVINDGKITATGVAGTAGWVGDNVTEMSKSAIIYHESANYPGHGSMRLEINGGTFVGVDHGLEVLSNEVAPNVIVNGGTFVPAYPEE